MIVTRRALGVLAAAAALVLGASTAPAQAHSTDDWTVSGAPPSSATCRYPWDTRTGVYASFEICRSGTNVWFRAYAEDLVDGDGWCGIAQIKYQIDANRDGVWDSHRHIRAPEIDCYAPLGDTSPYYRSNHPTRELVGRACIGYSDGASHACDPWE